MRNDTLRLFIDIMNDLAKTKLETNDKITPLVFGSKLAPVVDFLQVIKMYY